MKKVSNKAGRGMMVQKVEEGNCPLLCVVKFITVCSPGEKRVFGFSLVLHRRSPYWFSDALSGLLAFFPPSSLRLHTPPSSFALVGVIPPPSAPGVIGVGSWPQCLWALPSSAQRTAALPVCRACAQRWLQFEEACSAAEPP